MNERVRLNKGLFVLWSSVDIVDDKPRKRETGLESGKFDGDFESEIRPGAATGEIIPGITKTESSEFELTRSENQARGIDEQEPAILPDVLEDESVLPSSGFRPSSEYLSGSVTTKELVEVLKTTRSKEIELLGIFFDQEILGHLSSSTMKGYSRDRLGNILELVKLGFFEDRTKSEKWLRMYRSRSKEGATEEYDLMAEIMEGYEEWRTPYLKNHPEFYRQWLKWYRQNNYTVQLTDLDKKALSK